MSEIRPNGTRYRDYKKDYYKKKTGDKRYDYEQSGILQNIMSRKIVETKNEVLQYILDYLERSIIFLLKYTDELKNFKNFHYKNR